MRQSCFFLVVGWSCLIASLCIAEPAGPTPPNIVLVLVDDLGYDEPGFMGSPWYQTPRLDRLASEGLVFTHAYANGSSCAPSRESILSGQYPARHGIYTTIVRESGKLLSAPNQPKGDDAYVNVAEALQTAGYRTALIGKWHRKDDVRDHGFDLDLRIERLGFERASHKKVDAATGKETYLLDVMTERALDFITARDDRPFFLYFSPYSVHSPHQAPAKIVERHRQKFRERPAQAIYAAMFEHLDTRLGQILDALESRGIEKNTLIVVTSDNGASKASHSSPLRGSKATLYEGGIRVPLLVRWPGKIEAGRRSGETVIGFDLFPTFLEVGGGTQPPGQPVDGRSLVPLFRGETLERKTPIFWHAPAYTKRSGPAAAALDGSWKLIEFFESGRLELYDLSTDPAEANNLAESNATKRDELLGVMRDWRRTVHAPLPTPREFSP
jgi:arylsulfatase A-like enzyme